MGAPTKHRTDTYTGAQLGLATADNLLAPGTGKIMSGLLDFRDLVSIAINVNTDETGTSTAGTAALICDLYDTNGANLISSIDLITAILLTDGDADYQFNAQVGLAPSIDVTVGSSAVGSGAQGIMAAGFCKIGLNLSVDEAGATGYTGVVTLSVKRLSDAT